ncbi:hypothetical protein [Pseudarthrobacter sp. N5]|uniref:hypothetical protein n=1 Tax=Pseudarthrobacter sp. N5 TaxID=3418416 RepID=UPI003CEF469B
MAKKLDVAPSALYNHFTSKQDVLRWLQDQVMIMVDVSGFASEPWGVSLCF